MGRIVKKDMARNSWHSTLTDPIKFHIWLETNINDIVYWLLFGSILSIIFIFESDKDFSFFLTLSGSVQMYGFLIMVCRVFKARSVAGMSLNTFICCSVALLARVFAIMSHDGYLPYDSSGDWFYHLVEIIALICSVILVAFITKTFKTTYNKSLDSIKWWHLVPVAAIFAALFHPSLNRHSLTDIAWAFALYLEAVAMLPQLLVFTRREEIEHYTSHFVASQGVARLLSFLFWVFSYHELNDPEAESLALVPLSLLPSHPP
eukprot:TRINITY_DN429_c0_g1_i2.p1 TRINITY_DN429_c0_g1~~TRINITY_DN429_c0_g1_i2.p1  ORF type:complete len:262 (-),score=18.96 TRINITY_DN429_c0_g1_i2:243-1028(-)